MFVVMYTPNGKPPWHDADRPRVWKCAAASWDSGAVVMTDAMPELARPGDTVPTVVVVPTPGSVIEIKP